MMRGPIAPSPLLAPALSIPIVYCFNTVGGHRLASFRLTSMTELPVVLCPSMTQTLVTGHLLYLKNR